jgi:TRAP-type uncharacterized transport system fused permease subunit
MRRRYLQGAVWVAAYVASVIASASPPLREGFHAIRFGAGFFIVPFAFIYDNTLILNGTTAQTVVAMEAMAIGLYDAIAIGFEGYIKKCIAWWEQVLFISSTCSHPLPKFHHTPGRHRSHSVSDGVNPQSSTRPGC